jgi:hypothetical protein
MQPAMGSGFASSKTPHPFLNCLKSLLNHSVLLSNKLGVTLAAMVNNSNSFHEQFPLYLNLK